MSTQGAHRTPTASSPRRQGRGPRRIRVYDCRFESTAMTEIELTSSLDFNDFLQLLRKKCAIHSHEKFVLTTTDRTVLDLDRFEDLQDGSTLYLLQQESQALPVATEEHITFMPHYNTLVESGTYNYYASQGQQSLPYTLAELIDNSLSATAKISGTRTIELRMLFDESLGKPAVIVLDNGCGMTSKQLNNWAVYRLSKFTRANSKRKQEGYVRPDPAPRSLNSDISYFGVGGKQAVFYIGTSAKMISKSVGSPDVHELTLSKEDFESKEKNNEDVYSGFITNRKPGDSSHVKNNDERFLRALIAEEPGKESFTAVIITGIRPDHVTFLKQHFKVWTTELAHIYHYYIHGVNGNNTRSKSTNSDFPKIDIQVSLWEKPQKCPRVINLREVDNDMQTLYINAAADTFEFKARTGVDSGMVEGLLRYHPFLYDRETYPEEPHARQAPLDEDDDDDDWSETGVQHQARGKRPIFEGFWNGRLIPYTRLSDIGWCASPGRTAKVPEECYSRFSGVLFTDDRFQVTTNKLTFMDLETKLRDKDTIFTHVVNGQEQRSDIKKEFTQWLKNCHEKWDKQVKFLGFKEIIKRTDVSTKKMQHPWATFSSIELDGKVYKLGQLVKSQRTQPILHGKVVQFLLYGAHDRDVFASGGLVGVCLEPKELYDMKKIIPISKIDRSVTDETIKKNIDSDRAKLPDKLKVDWPDSNPWPANGIRPAGTVLGPLKVEILNKKGEAMSRMPAVGQAAVVKLSVELKVFQKSKSEDEELLHLVAQHSAKWGFWFRKIENLSIPGRYRMTLNTIINESNATTFGGKSLPSYTLNFSIKEGPAEKFILGAVSPTLCVGVPFDIPLQLSDHYGNPVTSPPNFQPDLQCTGLDLSYKAVDSVETKFTIKGVRARGKVQNYQQCKTYELSVTLPGLKESTQTIRISLLPGNPHSLHVKTEDDSVTVENGNPARFNVEIHDEAGNITTHPKLIVHCQVPRLPLALTDCSSTGAGQLVTKPINLNIIRGKPQELKVVFSMPGQKSIAAVTKQLRVVPSSRVTLIEICSQDNDNLVVRNNEKIEWLAGSSLENLHYKLYDEAGRAVPLNAEIASKIKVNWQKDVNLEDLVQGKLPDIKVPTQVQEEPIFQVSYHDQSVSSSFTVVPRPNEPTQLKATVSQSTVQLGKTLSGNISLELVDQYNNATKTLTSTCVNKMTVEAKGLDQDFTFIWQESSKSVQVTGIRLLGGTPGLREIRFTWLSYVGHVIVEVTPGDPALLKLVSGPKEPLQVLNGHGIPTPFVVQLCDKWGNPSPDQRVVVELMSSPLALKVKTAVISQPVDNEGKASFTVNSLNGPKGYYQLDFRVSFNKKPIPGTSVSLTVLPDPDRPVRLSVNYNATAKFPAGGTFPVFSVTVLSDDGSPMTTFNPAAASMFLWEGAPSDKTPPPTASVLKCSKPMEKDRKDCFHFRDKDIPERVGKYTIQFSLSLDKTNLFSKQITANVVANRPVKLGPVTQPPAAVVSCCQDIRKRILVKNMTLRITDSYGNPAGQDLRGEVVASIRSSSSDCSRNLPLFEGKTSRYQMKLSGGEVHISSLAAMEYSPGEDGREYILHFQPEVSKVPEPLAPFELTFLFYNDGENQRNMCELLKKKGELTAAVTSLQDIINDYQKLTDMLKEKYQTAVGKEAEIRKVLLTKNVKITQPLSIPDINKLRQAKTLEASGIKAMQKRVCSIQDNFRGQQDVLGMVGHLAFVQDEAAARVISWLMRGDMDCVITRTLEAAQRIYQDTQGRQQVMSLDSMDWRQIDRPLPHIRDGRALFNPSGNPIYARELLLYSYDRESCDKVFKVLLGDTILIDDLASGTSYRRAVVQNNIYCPTILTREGDMISAKGKFGGAHNKAPSSTTLPVFGAPLPQTYYTLKEQMDLLCQYQTAVEKRREAERERDEQLKTMASPGMLQKQRDKEERQKQLQKIEEQLMSNLRRAGKRSVEDAAQSSGIMAKRGKQTLT